ncbi:MAG: metallophosphoesterase [Vicinamibacterales bacterium]
MRIAALYDIHGNLPALEAVLAEVRQAAPDLIVIGGDVVPGPMARECVEAVLALGVETRYIHGNGEREGLAELASPGSTRVPDAFKPVVRWSVEQLSPSQRDVIGAWPDTVTVEIPGLGPVLFCHATPRNDTDIFTRLTPEAELRPVFEAVEAPLVVCGHTHMAFDRTIGLTRVVNAGSVGMPFGPSGADWLLIGRGVEFRHTTYDLAAAAARIRATAYPMAEAYASDNVLNPPAEEAMLRAFSRSPDR